MQVPHHTISYKTQKEIAAELTLSDRTFQRHCQKKDLQLPRILLCPSWQKLMYETFFWPATVGVTYTPSGMRDLLHRLGFVYKQTKGVPSKAEFKASVISFLHNTKTYKAAIPHY